MTGKHRLLVEKYLKGVQTGTAHAQWKDDAWDQTHPADSGEADDDDLEDEELQYPTGVTNNGRAKGCVGTLSSKHRTALNLVKRTSGGGKLLPLVQKGFLQAGDIVAFKHRFAVQNAVVQKDALVRISRSLEKVIWFSLLSF